MLTGTALAQRGVTLVELLITLAVVAVVLTLAAPAYSAWIQNTQIRSAAEPLLVGVKLARAEALKRNATVHFQLMSSTDSTCALSTTGPNWVVSINSAAGLCDVTDSSQDPFITRRNPSVTAAGGVTFSASQSSIDFDGLGRVTPAPANDVTIDMENPAGGNTCAAVGGNMRCLRVQVTAGGQARMCDPAVTASGDVRKC